MQIFNYGNPSASIVLIQSVDDHDLEELETEINEIRKQVQTDFQLIAVKVSDWNHDLSPWKAPAVFGKDDFGDGAKDMLRFVLDVLNLKSDPMLIGSLRGQDGYFPAYHMNKEKWISVLLGKPELDDSIKDLLALSYELTAPKKRGKK